MSGGVKKALLTAVRVAVVALKLIGSIPKDKPAPVVPPFRKD